MDIDKDIFDPDRNIRRFHDGAYLYRSRRTNDYDVNRYNIHYEQYRQKRKIQMQKDLARINELNIYGDSLQQKADIPLALGRDSGRVDIPLALGRDSGRVDIPIFDKSIGSKELLTNFKDTLFNIMDDLLQYKFTVDTFTKDNRLLYLGILLIIISIIIFIFYILIPKI
uniref:Uncharacterized protein n=1 Tax=Mimivirus LCMiAC02 TaxID=2506609 RepID=A0A481Z3U3_9VIRU|nr:MAG: hypothetical protein LCMiAC02_01690 [Mimivirus LCMiAC02]